MLIRTAAPGGLIDRTRYLLLADSQRLRRNALGALLLLAAMPSSGLGIELCPFAFFTGIICPTCGICRSVSSLLHGDLAASLGYHPLGIVVAAGLLYLGWFNRYPSVTGRLRFFAEERTRLAAAAGVVVLVWVVRLAMGVRGL